MRKILVTSLLLVLFLTTCDTTYHQTIPYKKVDFTIYPNDVMYYRLNTYGGYEYFTGGISGIVVFRLDEWTFKAYDRSCSYDWEELGSWIWMHPNGITLVDSLCGSIFNVLDGTVISGPAKWPLREYHTRYDGMKLRVYS
jgi:hypothetical protein